MLSVAHAALLTGGSCNVEWLYAASGRVGALVYHIVRLLRPFAAFSIDVVPSAQILAYTGTHLRKVLLLYWLIFSRCSVAIV